MAESKRKTARKRTTRKATPQTLSGPRSGSVRVPPGGIDPRLVEQRDKQREAEKDVSFARTSEPAPLDPKLAKIREQTIEQEKKLANRSLRKPPVRTSR